MSSLKSSIGVFLVAVLACAFVSNAVAQSKLTFVVLRSGGSDLVYQYNTTKSVSVSSLPTTANLVRLIGGWDLTTYSEISTNSIGAVSVPEGVRGQLQ